MIFSVCGCGPGSERPSADATSSGRSRTRGASERAALFRESSCSNSAGYFFRKAAQLEQSVTIRASHAVASGFRFELKEGSVYYDFTDETIADALKAFINPSLQAILNGKDG